MLQVPGLLPRWLVANRALARSLSVLLPRFYDVELGVSSATLTYVPDLRRS
jgi:hypothetical protein